VRTVRSSCIASNHLNKKLNNKLKVVISPLSETESESFTISFYGNPLNSACAICYYLVFEMKLKSVTLTYKR
jgi:hypothetical protein